MIKRFSTYILALLSLASCSDDFDMPHRGLDEDGNLTLSFSVAPLKTVATRAGDSFSSVTMYVYNSGDGAELQVETLPVTGGSAYVSLKKQVLDSSKTPIFYFVANGTSVTEPSSGTAQYKLENSTTTALDDGSNFTLSSKGYSLSEIKSTTAPTISLMHNAVKLTVTEGEGTSKDQYGDGSVKYSFCAVGAAQSSLLLAGGLNTTSTPSAYTDSQINGIGLSNAEKFVHPTNNTTTGFANKTFVIVKANYKANQNDSGKDYYYRLDFQQIEGTGSNAKTKAIDLQPNHWYQFLIKSVNGPGYATPAEAAKNPSPMVEYAIHDHAPVIYNMISDGMRELGVSNEIINYNREKSTEENPNTKILNVKLYSPTANEMSAFSAANIIIPEECDWLEVGEISIATDADHGSDGYDDEGTSASGDKNSKGKVYNVTLKFTDSKNPGTLDTYITVNWYGLSRDVRVEWVRNFDASKLFSPDVEIKAFVGENHRWSDASKWNNGYSYIYFKKFLGNDENETPLSFGTSESQNNGDPRNVGLHFPVMYGENQDIWTYMYKVTINEAVADGEDFDWEVSHDGRVSNIKITDASGNNQKTSGNKSDREFYVTRTNSKANGKYDDWNYEVGKLNISITVGTDEPISYSIDLYHTGFFHQDEDNESYIKGSVNSGFTYYEVVTVGDDHWLDRNIGAKSAQMYIEGAYGPDEAAGYYIVGAEYDKYNTPIMYEKACPPGYEVPSVEQWNTLRSSADFHTDLSGAYYNAYYQTNVGISENNPTGKRVYFPKARYYEGSSSASLIGNARSGYYWTRDASTGTEKEEIGNWLRCLTFTGSATSFMNGRVKGKPGSNPFYMSMRAVAKREVDNTVNRFEFQVEGATHVYLYTVDTNNKRTPVNPWPGQSLGNYQTMLPGQAFPVSYESKTATSSNLYVIFNYVGKNGQIYTMSNDVYSNQQAHTQITDSENVHGWLVYGANEFSKSGCGVKIDTSVSQEGTVWTCTPNFNLDDNDTYFFRIYWPESWNKGFIHLWLHNDISITEKWGDGKPLQSDRYGWVCYNFSLNKDKLTKTLKFKFNDSGDTDFGTESVNSVFGNPSDKNILYCAYIESENNSFKMNSGKPERMKTSLELLDDEFAKPQNKLDSNNQRIICENTNNWGTVYLHHWYDNNNTTTWPGVAMTKIEGTEYYWLDISKDRTWIIFTNGINGNGNDKTGDIKIGLSTNEVQNYNGWIIYKNSNYPK
ncbi:MAG: starch-binding protein [Muribaculaceae bacterium]|nr:starch-binding protein [Muribaculaceae bacterium]